MRPVLIACIVTLMATHAFAQDKKSPGDMWEQSLKAKKQSGTLQGPKPGQKCLWSSRLGACLWYTPGQGIDGLPDKRR